MRRLLLAVLASTALFAQEKVILDTDSGFFGDDGAALVMLLRSPEKLRLLGVTVVSGNVWSKQGAEYMFHTLRLLGRDDVPVFLGANLPLTHRPSMLPQEGPLEFTGAFGRPPDQMLPPFGGRFTGRKVESEDAVDFIIRTVEGDPGQVTILAIGPMTNVALALRKRPAIAGKIKRLVFMGGNLHVAGNASKNAEFNFWFDPEAADEVLRSAIKEKVMFGLDICNRAPIRKKQFDELIAVKTPLTEIVAEDMGNRYPGFFAYPEATTYVWDSLAAGWLLDEAFVTRRETQHLEVDTTVGKSYGQTRVSRAASSTPVQVMLDLDFPRFFAMYKRLLSM
jgi:inosine-uridine nucleoside N-ribohydrolase